MTPSNYPQTLVEQARALLSPDAVGRPRQANLRRAISSAYYGLFHRLCADATASMVGTARSRQEAARFLVRKFEHGRMRGVCESFVGKMGRPALPDILRAALGARPLDVRLADVCAAFVKLQDERHRADYDLSYSSPRLDAVKLVDQAEAALGLWEQVKNTDQARLFKLCLLVGTAARG